MNATNSWKKIFLLFVTKKSALWFKKFWRLKCIVLKCLNPKFQLLNYRKWWFYEGLKPWHYLWDTLYYWGEHDDIFLPLFSLSGVNMATTPFSLIWGMVYALNLRMSRGIGYRVNPIKAGGGAESACTFLGGLKFRDFS